MHDMMFECCTIISSNYELIVYVWYTQVPMLNSMVTEHFYRNKVNGIYLYRITFSNSRVMDYSGNMRTIDRIIELNKEEKTQILICAAVKYLAEATPSYYLSIYLI